VFEGIVANKTVGSVVDRLLGLGESRTDDVVIDKDIRIPRGGGVELVMDRYRPREVTCGPVVLIRTPYDKNGLISVANGTLLARRGLQTVIQDVRGTFGSGGDFEPFHHETDDGLATVDWIRAQPWCDGRVAMAGPSYVGYTQWAVAPYAEPRLSAIVPAIASSNFRHTFYPGGSAALQMAVAWASQIGTQADRLPPVQDWLRKRRTVAAMNLLPVRRADQAAIDRHLPFLDEVLDHSEPVDEHWNLLDHGGRISELNTPTSMITGWYDIFISGQLRDFTALQDAGVPARITIGPWWHTSPGLLPALLRDQVDWLTGQLGGDETILHRPAVRLYLQQANHWLEFDRWPVAATAREFLLGLDGGLTTETPLEEGSRAFWYDPADPTPVVGGAVLNARGGQWDNRRVEARDDVLIYQNERLDHDVDVIGTGTVQLYVRTDHRDADVFVRVCDVDRNGRSLNVVEGIRRLRPDDEPIDDLGTRQVAIDLWPTAYRFLRGHRIRVQVSGGAFPNYIRNHQTGEPIGDAVRTEAGRTQILHGPEHPSKITLPIFAG
jgi:putative CocE/NonD family hydrolase